MLITDIKKGTRISDAIRTDAFLELSGGVAQYLASDEVYGHALLHIMDASGHDLKALEKTAAFQSGALRNEVRCGAFEDKIFFSEPFPLGEFMFEWLERRERVGIAEAIKRMIKLLHVLQKAHDAGIFHGHITPKTILMQRTTDTFELRIMGLGVAQALPKDRRLNIDWFDYTFDLEGMTPQAVDIYGAAIALMGLVSGEQGIDSFEATGLLPQVFRGGMLRQAMERALALRIDTYADVLTFSQELEASLLELDAKEGEVYVGDLVGFESAIKSIASISEEHHAIRENSGVWSSIVSTLEQEERSSLLCSLTSLTSLKPAEKDDAEDDDDDVTRISAMSQAVLGFRRIKSSHNSGDETALPDEKTHVSKVDVPDASDSAVSEVSAAAAPEAAAADKQGESAQRFSQDKLAEIQNLESQIVSDSDGEEDDSPTRVVQRPNYISISVTSGEQNADSVNEAVEEAAVSPLEAMKNRIALAPVAEATHTINPDTLYDDPDDQDAAQAPEADDETKAPDGDSASAQRQNADAPKLTSCANDPKTRRSGRRSSSLPDSEIAKAESELKSANDALRKKAALLKRAVVALLLLIIVILVAVIIRTKA